MLYKQISKQAICQTISQTDLNSALKKIKVIFQQPKFEVVFQIRVYLNKTSNQNCQTSHLSNYATNWSQICFKKIMVVFQQPKKNLNRSSNGLCNVGLLFWQSFQSIRQFIQSIAPHLKLEFNPNKLNFTELGTAQLNLFYLSFTSVFGIYKPIWKRIVCRCSFSMVVFNMFFHICQISWCFSTA